MLKKKIYLLLLFILTVLVSCNPPVIVQTGIDLYTGQLGSTYLGPGSGTKFAVYAPNATSVSVAGSFNSYSTSANPMTKTVSGVWETTISSASPGDTYKYYSSDFNGDWVRDPYGNAFDGSGNYNTIIMSDNYSWADGSWTRPVKSSLVIYEMHVKDFTRNDSDSSSATYQGVIDKISYLTDLGVNAVELMPIQDWSGTFYSWGYNSACYFAPENSLSDNNNTGKAYQDFKKLVDALHLAGIAVILDVVYNHTFNDAPMWKIDPEVYYDTDAAIDWGIKLDLTLAPTRRFVDDNLRFWMDEFHVDGFRFDSTENIDSDAMLDVITSLRNDGYSDRYYIFEEFNGIHNDSINTYNTTAGTPYISSWGTGYKNAIWDLLDTGSSSDMAKVTYYSQDDRWNYPGEVINYFSSHDEGTLTGHKSASTQEVKVATVHLLTSLGIPMLWMGEEVLRIHFGNHVINNTLEATNSMDWDALRTANSDVYSFFASLIKLRIAHPALHQNPLGTDTFAWNNNGNTWSDGILGYTYKNISGDNDFVIILNYESASTAYDVTFPQSGTWHVMCDGTLATNVTPALSSFDLAGTTTNITVGANTGLIFMSDAVN